MNKVIDAINADGLFIGQLFGMDDEWNTPDAEIAFCSRTDVDKLFDSFKHVKIQEVNEKGATASGDTKHWHVFNIIAQK